MAIESENPQVIIDEINNGITGVMNKTILELVKTYLASSVYRHVYPLYEPTMYERREESGGIADKDMYYELEDLGGSNEHTIMISDPRPEVAVVESGEGYEWTGSRIYHMQPFPRPYFSKVDEELPGSLIFEYMESYILTL